jgi:hypothetical protein
VAEFPPFAFTTQEDWYGELTFRSADDESAVSLSGRQFVMLITPAQSGASLVEPVYVLTMAQGGGLSLKEGDPSTLLFRISREITRGFARGTYTGDVLEVVGDSRYLFMPVRIDYAEPSALRAYLSRFLGVKVSFASRQQPIYTPLAIPGRQGAPGATIINGTVAPVPAIGRDGDFFIEDRGAGRGRRMYGPKAGGAWPGTAWNIQVAGLGDVPGLNPALTDLGNRTAVVSLVVQGTQDGKPTVDQRAVIQAAWDQATTLGLPLLLTPGDGVQGVLDVRINGALRGSRNGARLRTDGRVRLHGYATEFTSTSEVPTDANIPVGVMVYFGPPAGSPVATYVSDVEAERITCVFHPPVDGQGNRIPSLSTVSGVYFDRCVRPRVRAIDVSGLNAGIGVAFASCRDIAFEGITVHDCAMVVDPTAMDSANVTKQISGVSADDLWAGRGIDPTVGGFVRDVLVYGLTSNRAQKQIDGVTDQGTRGVVWDGIVVRDADEGLDTYGTGSTYSNLDFSGCTCDVKVGHGAYNNTITGRGRNGSSASTDGRSAVVVFAGNRGNTARNSITWETVGFTGTRLIGVESDNANGKSNTGATITTKVVDCVIKLTARSCQTLRLMSEAGTGTGNVVEIDIDPASVAATTAGSEAEYLQTSGNSATRITIHRGAIKRPVAATAAAARSQGASYATGYQSQQNGTLTSLSSWAELDLVHGQTGFGLMRRLTAGAYEFLAYDEGAWTPTLSFATAPAGLVYVEQTGRYVKVGKQVTVQGRLTLSSKGTGGAGAVRLAGLPFASNGFAAMGVPRYNYLSLPAGNVLNGFVNGTAVSLQGASSGGPVDVTYDQVGNNFDMMFSLSYVAAA